MSHDFINPPCKRFSGTQFDNIGYNTVRAHHSLQSHGCSRIQSLKFLSRTNCKIDSSVTTLGPKQHSILRLRHDKHLCIKGWDYGQKFYDTLESNRDTEIESIRKGDEMFRKLEQYDDKIREQDLYNFGYQERFAKLLTEQFKMPADKSGKIEKILALKKQMRKMNKVNQETLSKISQQELESCRLEASSRLMSSTKRSTYQIPLYSECDSVIQHCDSQNFGNTNKETESPNLKSISDFRNKIFGSYIKRVSKQNSQPTLFTSQKSFRKCKPLKNLLTSSGIQLRENKTRTQPGDKSYYSRNVFFPTESTLQKHSSLQQSQYQF